MYILAFSQIANAATTVAIAALPIVSPLFVMIHKIP